MLHGETQMSIVIQYQRVCTGLSKTAAGVRESLMESLSNLDQEHPKYYTLLHLEYGGHPPSDRNTLWTDGG